MLLITFQLDLSFSLYNQTGRVSMDKHNTSKYFIGYLNIFMWLRKINKSTQNFNIIDIDQDIML